MEDKLFDWFEYIVFSSVLILSSSIGIFFCWSKGGQHTVSEYYLGNKSMAIFPIAMSLIASSISGITLLGLPAEVYFFGSQFVLFNVGNLVKYFINVHIFLPVFYNLQVVSLYEYLEMRFDHKVRILVSILFTIAWLLYVPVVIYSPSLAFNRVSGMNIYLIATILCAVCIFYTSIGGLKAVVWADTLQGTVMTCSLLVIIITGLINIGGIGSVFSAAYNNDRLDIFDMDPDPTKRLTFWSSTVGLLILWLPNTVCNPAMVQRYISLPTLTEAKRSALYQSIGVSTVSLLTVFFGLVIYAYYEHCDPLASNLIKREDQIVPHYVLDVAGHIKGIPGLFVAGIVCAALSTMSTCLNTLAGTIYEDFIEPIFGKQSDRTASNCMKILSIILGIICTAFVAVIDKMGNIIYMTSKLYGVTSGAIVGIFTMGVLMPQINSQGAFYSGILSAVFMLWTMIGHELNPEHKCVTKKVISIDGCANKDNITIVNRTCEMATDTFKMIFPTNNITVFNYGIMGVIISIFFGVLISYITGLTNTKEVNPDLFSPVIRKFLPKQTAKYNSVPLEDSQQVENEIKKDNIPHVVTS